MFERLFPTIARMIKEWPTGKWLALPAIFFLLFLALAGIVRAVMEAEGWAAPTIFGGEIAVYGSS
jgi:hypothetical protein